MRYTIIFSEGTVAYTDYYEYNNNWDGIFHFMIINNISHQYTTNGKDWIDIEDDHL